MVINDVPSSVTIVIASSPLDTTYTSVAIYLFHTLIFISKLTVMATLPMFVWMFVFSFHIPFYYLRNKSWKPDCVGSFNMDISISSWARGKDLIRTCAGECDWLFHWQYKLCASFSANVNINYRLPIKVYYCICTLRHIRIEINHGSQNVFW
jgi:hypothetical protein